MFKQKVKDCETLSPKTLVTECNKISLQALADKWPAPVVVREKIEIFSGGAITVKTIANLDSAGLGPKGRFRIGRKVCYPVNELVNWLESRSSSIA
jgi:hypothetical protein